MHASNKINKVKLFSLSEQKAFLINAWCLYSNTLWPRGLSCISSWLFLRRAVSCSSRVAAKSPGVPTTLVCTFPAFNDLNSREHRQAHHHHHHRRRPPARKRAVAAAKSWFLPLSVVCVCNLKRIPTTQAYLFFASTQLPIKHTHHINNTTQQFCGAIKKRKRLARKDRDAVNHQQMEFFGKLWESAV